MTMKKTKYILKLLISLSFLLSFNSFSATVSTFSIEQNYSYDTASSSAQHTRTNSSLHKKPFFCTNKPTSLHASTDQIRIYDDGDDFSSAVKLLRPSRGAFTNIGTGTQRIARPRSPGDFLDEIGSFRNGTYRELAEGMQNKFVLLGDEGMNGLAMKMRLPRGTTGLHQGAGKNAKIFLRASEGADVLIHELQHHMNSLTFIGRIRQFFGRYSARAYFAEELSASLTQASYLGKSYSWAISNANLATVSKFKNFKLTQAQRYKIWQKHGR